MQNICNLIGWNSVHISDIFNSYRSNINGMWNAVKLGGIYLIARWLEGVSINKSIAPKFVTVKVSQNLSRM